MKERSMEAEHLIGHENFRQFTRWLNICFMTGRKRGVGSRKRRKVCKEICAAIEDCYVEAFRFLDGQGK